MWDTDTMKLDMAALSLSLSLVLGGIPAPGSAAGGEARAGLPVSNWGAMVELHQACSSTPPTPVDLDRLIRVPDDETKQRVKGHLRAMRGRVWEWGAALAVDGQQQSRTVYQVLIPPDRCFAVTVQRFGEIWLVADAAAIAVDAFIPWGPRTYSLVPRRLDHPTPVEWFLQIWHFARTDASDGLRFAEGEITPYLPESGASEREQVLHELRALLRSLSECPELPAVAWRASAARSGVLTARLAASALSGASLTCDVGGEDGPLLRVRGVERVVRPNRDEQDLIDSGDGLAIRARAAARSVLRSVAASRELPDEAGSFPPVLVLTASGRRPLRSDEAKKWAQGMARSVESVSWRVPDYAVLREREPGGIIYVVTLEPPAAAVSAVSDGMEFVDIGGVLFFRGFESTRMWFARYGAWAEWPR